MAAQETLLQASSNLGVATMAQGRPSRKHHGPRRPRSMSVHSRRRGWNQRRQRLRGRRWRLWLRPHHYRPQAHHHHHWHHCRLCDHRHHRLGHCHPHARRHHRCRVPTATTTGSRMGLSGAGGGSLAAWTSGAPWLLPSPRTQAQHRGAGRRLCRGSLPGICGVRARWV